MPMLINGWQTAPFSKEKYWWGEGGSRDTTNKGYHLTVVISKYVGERKCDEIIF